MAFKASSKPYGWNESLISWGNNSGSLGSVFPNQVPITYLCTMKRAWHIIFIFLLMTSCVNSRQPSYSTSCLYAHYFDIVHTSFGKAIVSVSPLDGRTDTLYIGSPIDNIVCMSTSHVACLSEIGADSVISAVSGIKYIANPAIKLRYDESELYDIGYESSLDYERILSLDPDVIVTYAVSSVEPQYISKLRSLGLPVLVLHDHLEDHPLARAEYIRLFGALTGKSEVADSIFYDIADRYESATKSVTNVKRKKVLMNVPYADAWYVPGDDSYMSQLIKDAGGEVLGAAKGTSVSRVMSIEEAWTLSMDADIWLNPGNCSTREELSSIHGLFDSFGPLADGLPIYNNTLRTTPEGGNDFYESGVVHPDLVLEDLIYIMSQRFFADSQNDSVGCGRGVMSSETEVPLHYFKPLL